MSSWWRRYAETHGVTITAGASWAKIVAAHFNAGAVTQASHPKRLGILVQTAGSPGLGVGVSWSRKLADSDGTTLRSSGARSMTLDGARAPLT